MRPIVHRAVKSLLAKSKVRFANGELMAKMYCKRYKMPFDYMMMCDNLVRFRNCVSRRVIGTDILSILYSGNLGHGRWRSIVDLCASAKLLKDRGLKVMVTAFAISIPHEAVNYLKGLDNLQILPAPSHKDLPSYLKGADILFLPETFDSKIAASIHLSISTKAHLYMMAEKPIVIYSSALTGIMDYAKKEKWACIVNEKNLNLLANALCELITNKEYSCNLVKRGIEVAQKNHEENKIRLRFLNTLVEIL